MEAAITCASDAGLDVDSLFVSADFHRFQARAQNKTLVTFSTALPGGRAAALTLAGSEGVWTSPITGAFGGVASAGPVPAAVVFALAQAATAWLRDQSGTVEARLRLPPDSFLDPAAAALENALFRLGWTLEAADLNYHLPVAGPAAFAAALGETKRQALRRLETSGARALVLPLADFERAYQVIARNHAARGFPMTMTWQQTRALAQTFPDRVRFYGVERDGGLLAAAVCLSLTSAYRYLFNWGEDPPFRAESPIILLAQGLMAACHADGVATLDLGIATDRSAPNPGLIGFKEMLRGQASGKRAYGLTLSA